MSDPYSIETAEQLRALIPEASAKTASKVVPHLGALERQFIESSPLVVLSTASRAGDVTVSPKGDAPGFVGIEDDRTLLIPDRPGNGLAFGLLNMLDNPKVGLLFVRPGCRETLRVDGVARLTRDPVLLERLAARNKHAVLVIRVQIERCFFHCAKAFIRSHLWEPEAWPEPFKLSWGAWAKQWYDVPDEVVADVDAEIARDESERL